MIVSELATNSHTHSGSTEFEVALSLVATGDGPVLCIEAAEQGRWVNESPVTTDEFAEGGRGIAVVCGYSAASGVVRDPESGTRVWARRGVGLSVG